MTRFILIVGLLMTSAFGYSQTKIAGIVMPNVVKAGEQYLKINGGGVREKLFIDLYVCALYLTEKSTSASTIINDDKPQAIKIRIISGMVDNENFEEALREGFDKSTGGNIAPIEDRMNKMIEVGFADDIETGDIYDLVYLPSKGCTLFKNQAELLTVEGLDFKKALLGIWLGDEPADESLKDDMLGN